MPEDVNLIVVHPYACPRLPDSKIYTAMVSLRCEVVSAGGFCEEGE